MKRKTNYVHTHTMEHHSAIKRKEVLTDATTWMNSENIMLTERSQTRKATQCMVPFRGYSQNRQIYRNKADYRLPGMGEKGNGE